MVTVRVPASSANMGAGFDSLGMAVGLYNTMHISETKSGLDISAVNMSDYVPGNENNLIYRSMTAVFEKTGYSPKGIKIVQDSEIPVTRGLGSSSACIIGGMLAANVISGRQLTYPQLLDLAVQLEGHPDNLAPALYGGFCVSAMNGGRVVTNSIKINPKIKAAVMIPDFFVATKKSRRALPESVSYEDAVFNISRASLFTSFMISGKTDMLRVAVQDRMHQSYRSAYIDGMEDIFEKSYELGAKAVYLSGSGPTITALLDSGAVAFAKNMHRYFRENRQKYTCKILSVDNVGAIVKEN